MWLLHCEQSSAPGGSRTPGTRFRKPLLYPLSYWGVDDSRGKAEKYPLSDVSLYDFRVNYCSIGLVVTALPQRNSARLPAVGRQYRSPIGRFSAGFLVYTIIWSVPRLLHLKALFAVVTSALWGEGALLRWLGRLVALAACCALLNVLPSRLVVIGPPQEVVTLNPKLGIHTRLTDEVEEWKVKQTLEMVRQMGSPWVVEYFPWGYYESRQGRYDWSHPDMVIDHARAQGLTVIARIDFVPRWARPPETTFRHLERDHFGDYAAFVGAFTAHFEGRLGHIIVWNEPNLSFEWGYRQPDPEAYAELLCLASRAAKAANPHVEVLLAGLAPTLAPPGSEWGMDDLLFLQRVYDAGASECFDALAIHAYGLTFPPDDPPDGQAINFRRAELIRDLMVRNGDAGKPCYITEGGWNDHPRWTKAVRPYQRIEYTIRAYEMAKDWPWCRAVCLWAFRYPWPQQTFQDYYTFVSPEFIAKPIYTEIGHYAHGEPYEYLQPWESDQSGSD